MFPQLEFQIPNGCCFCSLIFCSFFFYFLGNWMYLLLVAGIFGVVVVVVWICIQLFTMGSKTERRCATCSSSRTSVEMNILPFVITFVPYTRLFRLVCMRLAVSVWAEKKKKKKKPRTLLWTAVGIQVDRYASHFVCCWIKIQKALIIFSTWEIENAHKFVVVVVCFYYSGCFFFYVRPSSQIITSTKIREKKEVQKRKWENGKNHREIRKWNKIIRWDVVNGKLRSRIHVHVHV